MITNTAMGMGKLTKVTMTWTNGYYDDEDDGGEKGHLDDNYYHEGGVKISKRMATIGKGMILMIITK